MLIIAIVIAIIIAIIYSIVIAAGFYCVKWQDKIIEEHDKRLKEDRTYIYCALDYWHEE